MDMMPRVMLPLMMDIFLLKLVMPLRDSVSGNDGEYADHSDDDEDSDHRDVNGDNEY